MKNLICIFSVFVSFNLFAVENIKYLAGKWDCNSFTEPVAENIEFIVDLKIHYKDDGLSVDTQTWKLKGKEESAWFELDLIGPWRIENGFLIEEIVEMKLSKLPENARKLDSAEVDALLKEYKPENPITKSKITKLSKSELITRNIDTNQVTTCNKNDG